MTKKVVHSLGGPGDPGKPEQTRAGQGPQQRVSDVPEAVPPRGRVLEASRAIQRETDGKPVNAAELKKKADKDAKAADDRTAMVRAMVNGKSLPESMSNFIVTHALTLSDDEIVKMVSDYEAGLVVSYGEAVWGEPAKP